MQEPTTLSIVCGEPVYVNVLLLNVGAVIVTVLALTLTVTPPETGDFSKFVAVAA